MHTHIETVSSIYEAFGRGDVPAILEHLSENVEWEQWAGNTAQQKGVPWMQARKGREGAAAFFSVVGAMEFREFRVLSIMAGGNQVAAEIVLEAVIPGQTTPVRDEEMHLWTFDESGKIIRMRHYLDTAKHAAAAGL